MYEPEHYLREQTGEPEKYYGKYPGLVVDNRPPANADHRGELVVDVPGILEESPDGEGRQPLRVTARPCFPPGFFFIPEQGAQIWVEFVAGDINSPVWTGVWYPNDATPRTHDDEAPTEFQKIIRTATGHLIQIDDSDGAEMLIIKHKSGTVIELKEDETISISCNETISISCKSLTISADEGVTIEGDLNVEGDLIVSNDTNSTTISGNEIRGG